MSSAEFIQVCMPSGKQLRADYKKHVFLLQG